jgi:membrane fusion protein (multidrug efflux system)
VLGGIKGAQIGALIASADTAGPPPETVTAAPAAGDVWASSLRAVGTVVAVRGITVVPEVPGMVSRIAFASGQDVRKGQILVQLDASVEQAELASAKAELKLAEVTLERVQALRQDDVNSPAELDQAQATAMKARARVQALEATIAKKTVRAPFAGSLGIRAIDPGQFLNTGTPIVSLQALDELYVDFSLPQRELARVRPGEKIEVRADAYGDMTWTGVIDTVEPSVDEATRNVRLRALVDNPGRKLRPGMFVDLRVELPDAHDVVVVPATSIIYAPYGDSAYVVEERESEDGGLVARQVFVRLGDRRGDLVEVRDGLEKGQMVVTTGGFKLRNGAAVVINNELAPKAEIDPDPEDS